MRNRFVRYCREHLDFTVRDYQYFQSISLSCLEASFNANTRFAAVENVLMRFCAWAREHGLQITEHTTPECPVAEEQITLTQVVGLLDNQTAETLAEIVGNRQKVAARLKTELFLELLNVLRQSHIETYQDFQAQFDNQDLENAIFALRGVGHATLSYLYMLTGNGNDIKNDRWIRRFAEEATGVQNLTDEQIRDLFLYASEQLDLTPRHLDHIVWDYMRN